MTTCDTSKNITVQNLKNLYIMKSNQDAVPIKGAYLHYDKELTEKLTIRQRSLFKF